MSVNITNNTRFRSTEDSMRNALFTLLRTRSYQDIYVKDICKQAGINRSSFYAHYYDINDFMIQTEAYLSDEITRILKENDHFQTENFELLFTFIREHKDFYRAYLHAHMDSHIEKGMYQTFRTAMQNIAQSQNFSYQSWQLEYHMAFFGGGLKAICANWLERDCKETPHQMSEIIYEQYKNSARFFTDPTQQNG